MMLLFLAALVAQAPAATPSGWGAPAPASTKVWPTREGDVVLKDFRFRSGESLPELHIHYTTLGTPQDITVQEIRIEAFFPADEATARTARRLSTQRG